ncbi:MAG: ABC transporter permease [Eubacterium sp.]|nr:ABC transporter permease [Eubacterium sp.]
MFQLLRMDLYRIKRSKSAYVCFGLLLLQMSAIVFMVWLLTPQGQQLADKIGFVSASVPGNSEGMLDGMDTVSMFRRTGLNGGTYSMIFGIWLMLFVCMDYQSGFMKNIMALHQNRFSYAVSKVLAAGIVNLCYLAGLYVFVLILNRLLGKMVPETGILDVVYYISWCWLITTAFAALMLLICVCTRSVAAGAIAAVLLGTGTAVMPVYTVLRQLHMGEWLEYSIYMTLSTAPDHYTSGGDLYVYAVGAVFFAVYTMTAAVVLKKQDI